MGPVRELLLLQETLKRTVEDGVTKSLVRYGRIIHRSVECRSDEFNRELEFYIFPTHNEAVRFFLCVCVIFP